MGYGAHSRGNEWAALVSPMISKDLNLCQLVFYYQLTSTAHFSFFVYITMEGANTEPQLLWNSSDASPYDVRSWSKQVLELPLSQRSYRIAFVGQAEVSYYRYLALDDVKFQLCNNRE